MSDPAPPFPEFDPRRTIRDAAGTDAPCALRWSGAPGEPPTSACRGRAWAADDEAFTVVVTPEDAADLAAVARRGGGVLTSIRRGQSDLLFTTPAIDCRPGGPAGASLLRLRVPDRVIVVARRKFVRVDLSAVDAAALTVRVWQIEDRTALSERPRASQEWSARPHDLGGGGMRASLMPRHPQHAAPLETGARLRIELASAGHTACFDGRLRDVRPAPGLPTWSRCGIEFVPHVHEPTMRRDFEWLNGLLATMQQRAAFRRAA